MSTNSHDDRWLLPRRQTEFPARDLLPEETLHGRREATFLVLAATFLVATTALLVLGTTRMIDVQALVARFAPAVTLPVAVLVPLGALAFAASFVASTLVCELFGRRRASALVWIGFVAGAAVVGLMRVADLIDGGGEAFGVSLALLACYVIAHATNVTMFDGLRPRAHGGRVFVRAVLAAMFAQALGWTAFAVVLHVGSGYIVSPIAPATVTALAIGGAACCFACIVVLAVPAALIARGLSLALRVGHDLFAPDRDRDDRDIEELQWTHPPPAFAEGSVARRLPPAVIVDDAPDGAAEPRRRAARPSLQPFSSAEMRFFSDGDALID